MIFFKLVFPKLLLALALAILGGSFLMISIFKLSDILLNTLALNFIFDLDEIFWGIFVENKKFSNYLKRRFLFVFYQANLIIDCSSFSTGSLFSVK